MARIADLLPCELAALAFLVSGLLCEQWVFSLLFYGTRGRVGLWTAAGGLHGLIPCPWRPRPRAFRAPHRRPPKRRRLRLRPREAVFRRQRPRFWKEGRGGAQDPDLRKLECPGDGAFTYSLPHRAEVPPHRGQEAVPPVCENCRAAVVPSRFQSPGGTIRGGWKPRHYWAAASAQSQAGRWLRG